MDGVTVGMNCGAPNRTVLILHVVRFFGWPRSSTHRLAKSLIRVGHFQCDIAHTIAMLADMVGGLIVGGERRCENKVCLALTQSIRSPLTMTSFQSAVGDLRKTESLAIEIGRLPSVADPEFDVMNTFKFEWILHPRALPDTIFAYFDRSEILCYRTSIDTNS